MVSLVVSVSVVVASGTPVVSVVVASVTVEVTPVPVPEPAPASPLSPPELHADKRLAMPTKTRVEANLAPNAIDCIVALQQTSQASDTKRAATSASEAGGEARNWVLEHFENVMEPTHQESMYHHTIYRL